MTEAKTVGVIPIRIEGDPILREVCQKIEGTPDLKPLLKQMHTTLNETKIGVGLAAPQIGRPIRLFITGGKSSDNTAKRDFINPEIVKTKGAFRKDYEACLSVPGVNARVGRHQKIRVKYYDADFKEHEQWFTGYYARIIQHEIDHLDGKEFYDNLTPIELGTGQFRIEMLRQGNIPKLPYEVYKKAVNLEKEKTNDKEIQNT